jgi:hypothetical protein
MNMKNEKLLDILTALGLAAILLCLALAYFDILTK